ncbi:MAG: SDR family NAD(P)-dependent oxidoreductase [Alphaproteobacteria bacterium]|jgi:3alpha(or 20beta)-hydroxysteroid dehydrogenase
MTGRFEGRVALVTGASRGQGAAEARLFARDGALVILADVLDEEGEATAAAIRESGGNAEYRHLDVASESAWAAMLKHIAETHGRIDILVNNAGVSLRKPSMLEVSLDDWNRVLSINLTGIFLGIKAAAPLMRDSGGGSIVNTSSIAGRIGHFATAYTTTKWALRGLTKSAAMEFAVWNIRVNAILPGLVDTPLVNESADFYEAMEWMTPMERGATPEEIANVVAFVASDEASYMTAADVTVDGGFADGGAYRQVLLRAMASSSQQL